MRLNPGQIANARRHAGLTQAGVAFALRERGHNGVEPVSVSRWERGKGTPHANVIADLASVLGVRIEKLYERSESGDDEEDEAALRRLARSALDRGHDDLAVELIERASASSARDRAVVKQ